MDKLYTYFGKNKIEVDVDNSQKLFSETSKIKNSVKPDTSYVDKALCDIPDPPEDTIKIPEVPVIDIPTPPTQIEIPKTLIASLLLCEKEGLYPCPDIRLVESHEMTEDEFKACDPASMVRVPYNVSMRFNQESEDYIYKDDPTKHFTSDKGFLYIQPIFLSKCCCDAENDEDVIEININFYVEYPRIRVSLPDIKFPCPELRFKTKVRSNKDGSSCALRKDIGKIDLELEAEADENDCRKLQINANMLFSIPDMVKAVRWENVAQNGCLTAKKLVVDRADLVVFDKHIQFCPTTRTEDLMFAPVEEANLLNNNPDDQPVSGEYTVIGSIDYSEDDDGTTISWQELKLKFRCGRLMGIRNGNSDSVTISTCTEGNVDPPISSNEEIPGGPAEHPEVDQTMMG